MKRYALLSSLLLLGTCLPACGEKTVSAVNDGSDDSGGGGFPGTGPEGGEGAEGGWPGIGAQREPEPHEYDDEGCTYFVSSSEGDDANDGRSAETPWRTLERANQLTAAPPNEPTAINAGEGLCFKRGDIFRTVVPIDITSSSPKQTSFRAGLHLRGRSGTADSPILIKAYGYRDEPRPRLLGSEPITEGWEPSGLHDSIFVVDVSRVLKKGTAFELDGATYTPHQVVEHLFIDRERMQLARFPNPGFGESVGGVPNELHTNIGHMWQLFDGKDPATGRVRDDQILTNSDIHGPIDWTGARLFYRSTLYTMPSKHVTGFDRATKQLQTDEDLGCGDGCTDFGYILVDHLQALDMPSEWYFDRDAERLYFWPPDGQNPNGTTVEAAVSWDHVAGGSEPRPARIDGIGLGDCDHIEVRDLEIDFFSGSGFSCSAIGGGNDHCVGITLADSDFYGNYEAFDLNKAKYTQEDDGDHVAPAGNVVDNNIFRDNECHGGDLDTADSEFTNNTLDGVGLHRALGREGLNCSATNFFETGTGLSSRRPNIRVRHNHFRNTGYHGIMFYGLRTEVRSNLFQYSCVTKADCGAISCWGRYEHKNDRGWVPEEESPGVRDSVIADNLILDSLGANEAHFYPPLGMGIFVQLGSEYMEVSNNTVLNSSNTGVFVQTARHFTIEGNLAVNNGRFNGSKQLGVEYCALAGADCPNYVRDNVLAAMAPDQETLVTTNRKGEGPNAIEELEADHNVYFAPFVGRHGRRNSNRDCSLKAAEDGEGYCYSLGSWQQAFGLDGASSQAGFQWFTSHTTRALAPNLVGDGTFEGAVDWNDGVQDSHSAMGSSLLVPGGGSAKKSFDTLLGAGSLIEGRMRVASTALSETTYRVDGLGGLKEVPLDVEPQLVQGYYNLEENQDGGVVVLNGTEDAEAWFDDVEIRTVERQEVRQGVTIPAGELPPDSARWAVIYNPSGVEVSVDLQGQTWLELDGTEVGSSFSLPGLGAKMLIAPQKIAMGTFSDALSTSDGSATLVVSNIGSQPLTISNVELSEANGVQLSGTTCTTKPLVPSAHCDVTLQGTGSGTLQVTSDDPNRPTLAVTLSVSSG